ncbi:photosystem I chlorophyll a apoprotein A1 [Tanacetum coccineum]
MFLLFNLPVRTSVPERQIRGALEQELSSPASSSAYYYVGEEMTIHSFEGNLFIDKALGLCWHILRVFSRFRKGRGTQTFFAQSSITINGWLHDFLWAQASQLSSKELLFSESRIRILLERPSLSYGKDSRMIPEMTLCPRHFGNPQAWAIGGAKEHKRRMFIVFCAMLGILRIKNDIAITAIHWKDSHECDLGLSSSSSQSEVVGIQRSSADKQHCRVMQSRGLLSVFLVVPAAISVCLPDQVAQLLAIIEGSLVIDEGNDERPYS